MKKKSILLLGGSAQQVVVIKKAKEAGYRTVLIDYLPDNPGKEIADKWYSESTTNIEKVYKIAKEEKVSGILAYASDPAALPAAIVCERLGLPSNPVKSVEILGVKNKFREFLLDNGFNSPNFFSFYKDMDWNIVYKEISKLKFPIVIKPTDSSGSKGVSFLENREGLKQAISYATTYSRNNLIIAEEFIERGFPDVIGGDIFVQNGKIVLMGDMACLRKNNGSGLIPIGKKKPNGLSSVQRKSMYEDLQRLVSLLNISFGEFNIEVIFDKNDNPYFLEIGPRAGGNMIPIQLSDAFNIDLPLANIKASLGEKYSLNPVEPSKLFLTYVLNSDKNGLLDSIYFSDEILDYIYRKEIYKKRGDIIDAFDGAGKAIGIVFMKFSSFEEMKSITEKLTFHIRINLS